MMIDRLIEIEDINNMNNSAWSLRMNLKEKAIELSGIARENSREIGYEIGIAESLNTLSYTDIYEGKYISAITNLEKIYKTYEKFDYDNGKVKYYYTMGIAYNQLCNYSEALDYNLKGINLAREINNELLVSMLNNIAIIYINSMQMYEEALVYLHEAFNLNFNSNKALILSNIGEINFMLGNTDYALECCNKALDLNKVNMDIYTEGIIFRLMGTIYKSLDEKNKALLCYDTAVQNFKRIHNKYYSVGTLADLANLHINSKEYKEAHKTLDEAYKVAKVINSSQILKIIHQYYGILYDKEENSKQALEHYKKYIEIKESLESEELKNKLNALAINSKIQGLKNDAEIYRLNNIELVRKSEELELSYKNISVIGKIGQQITSTLEIDNIMNIVHENVKTLMDGSGFGIDLYDENTRMIDYIFYVEEDIVLPRFQATIDTENSYAARCILKKEALLINDIAQDVIYVDNSKPTKSLIYCPLILGEKVLGAISVQSFKKNAYSQINFSTIKALASYIAIAVNNSQKSEELKKTAEILSETLKNLKDTQDYLIQSEKMAALGQLISGIAHEINTPLGAIQASINNISKYMEGTFEYKFPKLLNILEIKEQLVFFQMLKATMKKDVTLSSKEERQYKKQLINILKNLNVEESDELADILVDMGIYEKVESYLPLLLHKENQFIFQVCYEISGIVRNTKNMDIAVGKASKMIYALKNYSHFEQAEIPTKANILDGIDTVLNLYSNNLKHGTELIKVYNEIPYIFCYPDELNQVWTNLIHNSLQAMDFKGILKIKVFSEDDNVIVSINDTGIGIPDNLKDKIFEPFFTTKRQGEGSGIGLGIVKNIILKHNGTIDVNSIPGNTTFTIKLPINSKKEI